MRSSSIILKCLCVGVCLLLQVFISNAADDVNKPGETLQRIHIAAGTFMMGDQSGDCSGEVENQRPVHQVAVSAFGMSPYEVTVGQFAAFLNKIRAQAPNSSGDVVVDGRVYAHLGETQIIYSKGAYCPTSDGLIPAVVTWYGASAYCSSLGGRLPSEAEWEYAARAGANTKYPWGDRFDDSRANGRDTIDEWDEQTSIREEVSANGKITRIQTTDNTPRESSVPRGALKPVGTYPPNQWGLYDMIGNAAEWCLDWYSADYYSWCKKHYGDSPVVDPLGPDTGASNNVGCEEKKVQRGGMYASGQLFLTCSSRIWRPRDDYTAGFRVVFPTEARVTH